MADVDGGTGGADSGERDARGGKYSEYGTRPDAALLGLGMVPSTRPSDGTPRQPATPPSEESLDDKDPRHVDIEVSADGDDGGGCSGGHHEYGMRPDTALIDLGMVPPTLPSDGTPLRPDIPASETFLGGEDHACPQAHPPRPRRRRRRSSPS